MAHRTRRGEHATDVIIVGAGTVGLAAALELGSRGVRVAVVDDHPVADQGPCVSRFDARSMEHFRRWGVADALRAAAEGTAERDLAPAGTGREVALALPQTTALEVLRARAAASPTVLLWLGWRAVALSMDKRGVSIDAEPVAAVAASGSAPIALRGAYAVGCDGTWSLVRRAAAIRYLSASGEAAVEAVEPQAWNVDRLVVERFRQGNLFLAGDAAHMAPPHGGHNLNAGIGDAASVGWRIAAVLQGRGDDSLLDGYEAERRPVALTAGAGTSNLGTS